MRGEFIAVKCFASSWEILVLNVSQKGTEQISYPTKCFLISFLIWLDECTRKEILQDNQSTVLIVVYMNQLPLFNLLFQVIIKEKCTKGKQQQTESCGLS